MLEGAHQTAPKSRPMPTPRVKRAGTLNQRFCTKGCAKVGPTQSSDTTPRVMTDRKPWAGAASSKPPRAAAMPGYMLVHPRQRASPKGRRR